MLTDKPIENEGFKVTVEAPVNIALIKYWGKRNEALILPLNDSISISINDLKATTTIVVGPHVSRDSVVVNGKEMPLDDNSRFRRIFREARTKFIHEKQLNSNSIISEWNIKVESTTNFPVAAGLASSAAGFAAIAVGFGRFFNLSEELIVKLARIGSGSACRSVQNGFVHWHAGTSSNDDSDCHCESLTSEKHWPELRVVVIVLNNSEKSIGSSLGMRLSVETSKLLTERVSKNIPERVRELRLAIQEKNFSKLAEITMVESDHLHSVCENTTPSLKYLNNDSRQLIAFVQRFNQRFDSPKLAYTFDAGPNCCLVLEESTLPELFALLKENFTFDYSLLPQKYDLSNISSESFWSPRKLNVEQIYCSEVGIGPKVVSFEKINGASSPFNNLPTSAISGTKVDCKML